MAEYFSEFTGKEIDERLKYGNHKNLLDNPWFTVNQRGVMLGQTGRADTYGFDRWTGTYNISGQKLLPAFPAGKYMIQPLSAELKNFLNGKQVTLSVMYMDGTVESGTIVYEPTPATYKSFFDGRVNAQIMPASFVGAIALTALAVCTIQAVKLELGSVSTLANDVPPNYEEELAKCQRYAYFFNAHGATYAFVGVGHAQSATQLKLTTFLPVPLRKTTSAYTIVNLDISKLKVRGAGGVTIPTALQFDTASLSNGNVIGFNANYSSSTLTPGQAYDVYTDGSMNLGISADL